MSSSYGIDGTTMIPRGRPIRFLYRQIDYLGWQLGRRHGPAPHLLKRRVISEHAARFGLHTLIETGTYLGDMIWQLRHRFLEIHSIELQPDLHGRALTRFAACHNVHLHLGDSAVVLPDIVRDLREPALFWLDGHYSGGITARSERDTPIRKELEHLLAAGRSFDVILIDDARLFTGQDDYPTISQVEDLLRSRPDLELTVASDIIRIVPGTGR